MYYKSNDAVGIGLCNSENSLITKCYTSINIKTGIYLLDSNNNEISYCTAFDNNDFGIYFDSSDEILITNGAQNAIDLLLKLLVKPQSRVFVESPTYGMIIPTLMYYNCEIIEIPMCEDGVDLDFMESVWWVFKQLWDKKLIYEDYKSLHICPRCETTLSQSEVGQGYEDVKDISVISKFELIDEPNTFILAWTTTPWTLPGNVVLAVGKKLDYVKVKSGDKMSILKLLVK